MIPGRSGQRARLTGQLIGLEQVAVGIGDDAIFSSVSLNIHQGDRIALVGRNGCGKSTLMKLLNGMIEPDRGSVRTATGLQTGYLPQDPELSSFTTVGDYALAGLAEDEHYMLDRVSSSLRFDPGQPIGNASGGEIRQAGLARMFARQRDIYLLDEPTNHLDLETIQWLEGILDSFGAAFVLISHDRRMLENLTSKTVWIDHGQVRVREIGYGMFPEWHDETRDAEARRKRKLDRKLRTETIWASEGISARRKRNQGRLRRLEALRREREGMRRRLESVRFQPTESELASQLVIEAVDVSHAFGTLDIIRNFTLRVLKGDRLAVIGPNGIGKTTLLDILTGRLQPDHGRTRVGSSIRLASMRQDRKAENLNMTVRAFLAGEGAHSRDRPDHVMFQGRFTHVISYLRSYQFESAIVDAPLKSLSGGEFGRLRLARVMLQESDLLVLDEPTNDLDMDTLDMLQDALTEYAGTVLFVSHDRDFLDNTATVSVMLEGGGKWAVYPGGWQVCQQQGKARIRSVENGLPPRKSTPERNRNPAGPVPSGLTFTERHRLAELDGLIASQTRLVTGRLQELDDIVADTVDFTTYNRLTMELSEMQQRLEALEEEWLQLAERAESGNGG